MLVQAFHQRSVARAHLHFRSERHTDRIDALYHPTIIVQETFLQRGLQFVGVEVLELFLCLLLQARGLELGIAGVVNATRVSLGIERHAQRVKHFTRLLQEVHDLVPPGLVQRTAERFEVRIEGFKASTS